MVHQQPKQQLATTPAMMVVVVVVVVQVAELVLVLQLQAVNQMATSPPQWQVLVPV